MSNILRSFMRAVMSEAVGQEQYQDPKRGRALDQFSAKSVLDASAAPAMDAVRGLAALRTAVGAASSSKSGRLKAGWSATQGSRKNILKGVAALGILGYIATENFRKKPDDAEGRDQEVAAANKLLAQFHNDVNTQINLDERQNSLIAGLATPGIHDVKSAALSEEDLNKRFTTMQANYNKRVSTLSKITDIDKNRTQVFASSAGLKAARLTIKPIIDEYVNKSNGVFDFDGLEYYACCIMYVRECGMIAAAMDDDMAVVEKIVPDTANKTRGKFDTYVEAKKNELDTLPAVKEATEVVTAID
jgi:hypothetical protein